MLLAFSAVAEPDGVLQTAQYSAAYTSTNLVLVLVAIQF